MNRCVLWIATCWKQQRTYETVRKTATIQGDDYITGYLFNNLYFKDNYKLIAKYLSKQ